MRVSIGLTVEDVRGNKYRCNSFGKDWVKVKPYTDMNKGYSVIREYLPVFGFIQFNTESTPISFESSEQNIISAINNKKLFVI